MVSLTEDEEREDGSGLLSLYNDEDNEAFTEEEEYEEDLESDVPLTFNKIEHESSPSEGNEEEQGMGG